MVFKKGHKKIEGSGRTKLEKVGKLEKVEKDDKKWVKKVALDPTLQKKYMREIKGLKGKQYIDAYHSILEFSIAKLNKIDPTQNKVPTININFVAAEPKQETIDITYGEVNSDNQEQDKT